MRGTALASTLLTAVMAAPTRAQAVVCPQPASPAPVTYTGIDDPITCVNTETRTGATGYAIELGTVTSAGNYIELHNSGNLTATNATGDAFGIDTQTFSNDSPITIGNSGLVAATSTANDAFGIFALASFDGSPINIVNGADITATGAAHNAFGIDARALGKNSPVGIVNSGHITATGGNDALGIYAFAGENDSSIGVVNSARVLATAEQVAFGIFAFSSADNSPIGIVNTARITATGGDEASGIFVDARSTNSPISIVNSGDIMAMGGNKAFGIAVTSVSSSVRIENSGSVFAEGTGPSAFAAGIFADSATGTTTIVNSGTISASSLLAIFSDGAGDTKIFNSGTITGYVGLDADDIFINQKGGVFEARLTSYFGPGSDLFRNESGATVHTASDSGTKETTRFVNLERFENQGTISLVDGGTGDVFTISNTVSGTDLNFVAGRGSTLAANAFLGGPGSTADNFIIEGNVSGTTTVQIVNTNTGPGVFNPAGIPVVFVTGETPNANAFFLDQPIDTGFFDYDLFFTPTGRGFWELRSFTGAGAFLLPQLVTAAQDIWHQGSSTWFDRTSDLRVLLAGGAAPAYGQGGKSLGGAPSDGIAPATWVRGSGSWLDRDDSASTSAYGRNYRFDLDRELETIDFQMGLDLGARDFLSQGDILVFGMLGGFIHGDLDYDSIARAFDFDGGQVGAYATYLKDGLFVDTLLNVQLYELDANGTVGFPSEIAGTTVGLRTDTGYRFGSFSGGVFLEPLATLEVTWADIDGFNLGGNKVSFDDDANVRGRLGLRAGTTMHAWEGTMMEPFVIGSLWGNLTGDNQATLVSTGSTFRFQDDLDDVWGEVSAGVNFFNPSATTSVFAKVDVTFGDDISGVGGKAGMRVSW